MACIRSAHFTILFHGSGDNFITPTRGIRQGCALSPYIFILCMNILTSLLQHDLYHGKLQGLHLTRNAPPLTNLMYADDLLIMGSAQSHEVRRTQYILQLFCSLSGQKISPEKSKLWFSKATPLAQIQTSIRRFGAGFAASNETYLRCQIDVSRPTAYKKLIEKVDSKLHLESPLAITCRKNCSPQSSD